MTQEELRAVLREPAHHSLNTLNKVRTFGGVYFGNLPMRERLELESGRFSPRRIGDRGSPYGLRAHPDAPHFRPCYPHRVP